jgi:hemoglobin
LKTLYGQIGGFDVILALTQRWHEICLQDPEAAHPFERSLHPHHNVRLAAYLSEAFGGPMLYTAGYGDESYMQQLHACNGVHVELDEACLSAFDRALNDVGVTGDTALRASAYFRGATEAQRIYSGSNPVPDGLPILLAP